MSDTKLVVPSLDKVKERRKKMLDAYEIDVPYNLELHDESLRSAELHFKYLKIYQLARLAERGARREMKRVRRDLSDYYRGFLNNKHERLIALGREPCMLALTPKDIDFYVDTDPHLLQIEEVHQECVEWVTDCEMILSQVDKRGYALKTALTYLQYKAQMT